MQRSTGLALPVSLPEVCSRVVSLVSNVYLPNLPAQPSDLSATAEPVVSLAGCEVRVARAEETAGGLRLLLGSGGYPADDARVAEFTALAVRKRYDLSSMVVVVKGGARMGASPVLWAVLPIVQPGRTVLMLTPPRTGRDAMEGASAAVELALRRLAPIRLAQALVDPDDPSAEQPLFSAGFQRMARLVYMQRVLAGPPVAPGVPQAERRSLKIQTYSPATHGPFREALAASYEGSLDCPRLNGLRDLDDILEGHRVAGQHNPDLWTVLMDGERPAAVVLLSPTDNDDAMELVYLGVSPAYRRKGLAHWCLQHALHRTSELGLSKLMLAVDGENRPALRLYYRFGLKRFHERSAMFRVMAVSEATVSR